MPAVWQEDLRANANRAGVKGALVGWFLNPGFAVVTLYRVSHWGERRGGAFGRLVAMAAWRRIVKGYGCYIAPTAVIGPGLRLPHPIGIVIGDGTVIGRDVTIYQQVTTGRANDRVEAYPTIAEGTIVYAGATIVGKVSVGPSAVIAAHAVVLQTVPADHLAAGIPARTYVRSPGV